MTPLLTVAAIRAAETAAAAGLPPRTLMQRAGRAVAHHALALGEGPFLFVAGPGNNGGDAFEAAFALAQAFRPVRVVFLDDAAKLPADARAAYDACVQAGVPIATALPARLDAPVIVDGLFGIGLARALGGAHAEAVAAINASGAHVLAIDVPSGIDADTGAIVGGADGCAVRADETVSFIAAKPGLYTGDGIDHAGTIRIDRIGIDETVLAEAAGPHDTGDLNSPDAFLAALQPRARNTHKGSFGSVAVLGGNAGMSGAGHLAARAALFAGAGRVFLHPLGERLPFDPLHPEIMIRDPGGLDPAHVVVAGPGLGKDANAPAAVSRVLQEAACAVLDADALNLIARDAGLDALARTRARRSDFLTLMTPHPLEAARLLGVTGAAVSADRIGTAQRLCERYGAEVVLKGAGSVCALRTGRWSINPTGNPGLASAGTGDVLAGLLGALLAANGDAAASLRAGVWLHGAAADALVARGVGPIGLTASELLPRIRTILNRLVTRRGVRG